MTVDDGGHSEVDVVVWARRLVEVEIADLNTRQSPR